MTPATTVQGGHVNTADRATFYGGGARGYTDYPPVHGVTNPDGQLVPQTPLARV
jgi:hypothetical protein